ncbi:MAG: hypothetical protein Q9197_000471 [Variospora fuerteventurae]
MQFTGHHSTLAEYGRPLSARDEVTHRLGTPAGPQQSAIHDNVKDNVIANRPKFFLSLEVETAPPNRLNESLSPLLWMASSNGRLEAYEYGLPALGLHTAPKPRISSEMWDSFASAFAAHVHAAGIADIVSLKSKQRINGGEFVAPDMRVLFRLPMEAIEVQPGSILLEAE